MTKKEMDAYIDFAKYVAKENWGNMEKGYAVFVTALLIGLAIYFY